MAIKEYDDLLEYGYDGAYRLTSEIRMSPTGGMVYEDKFTYDAVGNLLRIVTHKYADLSGPVAILGMRAKNAWPFWRRMRRLMPNGSSREI